MRITLYIVLCLAIVGGFISANVARTAAKSLAALQTVVVAGNTARLAEQAAREKFKEQDARRERDRQFAASLGMSVDDLYRQRELMRNN